MENMRKKILDFLLENYAELDWERDGDSFDAVAKISGYQLRISSGREGCWLNVNTIPFSGCGYTIDEDEFAEKVSLLYKDIWALTVHKKENSFWNGVFVELKNATGR